MGHFRFAPMATRSIFRSGLLSRPSFLATQFANTTPQLQSVRHLNLHEYQSKALMEKYNVRVQRWRLAATAEEAETQAKDLNAETTVVKAQVHAGGRGKGQFDNGFQGGVKLCKTPEEVREIAGKMIGHRLTTKQTTPEGGMDIEAVAEENPEAIFKVPIDIHKGPVDSELADLAGKLGFSDEDVSKAVEQMKNLYQLFLKSDALQVEINPLVQVPSGEVYCVDAKIGFDDNASFRQKEIFDQRDTSEEDPREVEASKYNLNYVGMEANIGCMVNGAGLAMATMDIIKLHGGEPANFLVGGGATTEQVKEA